MALVNYDSDSDSEGEAAPAPPPPASSAKPPTAAPKLVDRANPRKIIVNLPSASASSDEPPAKRARTEGGGGGRFGAFRSALPPPKNTVAPVAASRSSQPSGSSSSSSSSSSAQPLPFSFFKTSAEAAFSREPPPSAGGHGDEVDEFGNANAGLVPDRPAAGGGMRMKLPAPKSQEPQQQGPSIPEGQKPESEVKLVGKPLMFRPLSVARKPAKKSGAKAAASSAPRAMTRPAGSSSADAVTTAAPPAEAPKKKKVSLFSLGAEVDEAPQAEVPPAAEGGYQPLFEDVVTDPTTGEAVYSDYASYQAPGGGGGDASYSGPTTSAAAAGGGQSLDVVADDLGLSAAARRELFGRGGSAAAQAATASRVINFNLDHEYRNNEEMRASGELQAPARAVKGIAPGKHNLRQLVNAVQSQKDALEESFAKNKSTQQEASSRYGWR
ncbi:hypothetical protein RB598_005600 [Gaeumannomyces tritici]